MRTLTRLSGAAVAAGAAVLIGAGPALAAAPSVTMDPAGTLNQLTQPGQHVSVSGTYRCDPFPGGTEKLSVNVTQGNRKAQLGGIVVTCTGAVLPWSATLITISPDPLLPGAAVGTVTIAGSSGSANNSPGQAMVLA